VAAAAALLGAAPPAGAQIYTRVNAQGVIEATNVPDEPGFRLTYPGKGTLIHSRGFRKAYRGEYDRHILDAAQVFGVSAELVHAVIQTESEYDALAVSSKGAQGLMQLMPFTARRFGVGDSFDPRQNIFGGVQYLRVLLDLFGGDVALAAAAYNAGENAVQRHRGIPPYRETRQYVQKVQARLSSAGSRGTWYAAPARGAAAAAPLSYAPAPGVAQAAAQARRHAGARSAERLQPARPRVYYKWQDERGLLHVAEAPPDDGVTYTLIRALD
jgi:hypothetical protein